MGKTLVEKTEKGILKGILRGWYSEQRQSEVWLHLLGPEALGVRLERWAETTLMPNWWAHGQYLVCMWVYWTCAVLKKKKRIKSTLKDQILHKSTFLASFEKNQVWQY